MKIFINDVPFRIIPNTKEIRLNDYDHIVPEARENIDFNLFHDDVLIRQASIKIIDKYIQLLKANKNTKIDSITFQVENIDETIDFVKKKYTIINAAGGLVKKNGFYLLIYRLGKWDLPKGKIDNNEKIEETAIREVTEECNISVSLVRKICHTWHTYKRNDHYILKKTSWFLMKCVDDSRMKPQKSENIEEIRWMDAKDVNIALYDSYPSIRHVFRKYFRSEDSELVR
ncbi:MAG TPA: NUDIX domain-containing protein [Cyclobacteriaceae bacterium]|nr:NUDIX domain-containing protein [Cyclobacteriaceae bacterium]